MPASTSADLVFSPAVREAQSARGSRQAYARFEANGGFHTEVTPDLAVFLAGVDTAFLATASADGQPYVQHRGGPPGFIRVLGARSLGFADFAGNRQYITVGNLSENPRALLFLMDYAAARRVKIWGRARIVEGDADLLARLSVGDYRARIERAVVFDVEAWDANCPQHIPPKVDAAAAAAELAAARSRIRVLEAELDAARAGRSPDR